MMKLEDIVHTFNDYLTVNRTSKKLNHIGYMVLLRSSTSPSTFTKALKEYELKLIYVKEKELQIVFKESVIDKVVTDPQEIKLLNTLELKMVFNIMQLLNTPELFDKYVNNEINGI